jgi:23S rRNA A2030 N6-methylase RlmJ
MVLKKKRTMIFFKDTHGGFGITQLESNVSLNNYM